LNKTFGYIGMGNIVEVYAEKEEKTHTKILQGY